MVDLTGPCEDAYAAGSVAQVWHKSPVRWHKSGTSPVAQVWHKSGGTSLAQVRWHKSGGTSPVAQVRPSLKRQF
jgi:hypothetical protein